MLKTYRAPIARWALVPFGNEKTLPNHTPETRYQTLREPSPVDPFPFPNDLLRRAA